MSRTFTGNSMGEWAQGIPAGAECLIQVHIPMNWESETLRVVSYQADTVNAERLVAPIVAAPVECIRASNGFSEHSALGLFDRDCTTIPWSGECGLWTFTIHNVSPNSGHAWVQVACKQR